jgi:hypothetical protein
MAPLCDELRHLTVPHFGTSQCRTSAPHSAALRHLVQARNEQLPFLYGYGPVAAPYTGASKSGTYNRTLSVEPYLKVLGTGTQQSQRSAIWITLY